MQKLLPAIFCVLLFFQACDSVEERNPVALTTADSENIFFPVTDFFLGQLAEIEKIPTTPLKIASGSGQPDSIWLKREEVRAFASPFLTPVIDSQFISSYFTGKSFLDQSINAFTLTYDAKNTKPASITLYRWNVYIDPQLNKVDRVYLVKKSTVNEEIITTQLTWKANEWCSIRKIVERPGLDPQVSEEKVIWNFD